MGSGLGYQDQHHLLVKTSTRLHLLFHYVSVGWCTVSVRIEASEEDKDLIM